MSSSIPLQRKEQLYERLVQIKAADPKKCWKILAKENEDLGMTPDQLRDNMRKFVDRKQRPNNKPLKRGAEVYASDDSHEQISSEELKSVVITQDQIQKSLSPSELREQLEKEFPTCDFDFIEAQEIDEEAFYFLTSEDLEVTT